MSTNAMPLLTLREPQAAADWLRQRVRGQLQIDSRAVQAGDGFMAWPGAAVDGRRFIAAALAQGARACLLEREGAEAFAAGWVDAPGAAAAVAGYEGLKGAAALVADAYYGQPSQALALVAVTGTNGKTSCAWWLAHALSNQELPSPLPCGLIGTLGIGALDRLVPSGMTTPDPVRLHAALRSMVDGGVRACAIEASSIGVAEQRLDGARIRVAVFTNFTQDHLDYHGSMDAYWRAKAALFAWPGLQAAVVNVDDPKGRELAASPALQALDLWTVSAQGDARLAARELRLEAAGQSFDVVERAHPGAAPQVQRLHTPHIGGYNVSNLLCVIGAMRALGVPLTDAVRACAGVPPVPGRLQTVAVDGQPLAVIDYAHTPDAVQKALAALRPLAQRRGGRLWCVLGCGGNRDASKRPLMAAAAARGADRVVLTSDNPRDEDPLAILADMQRGLPAPRQGQRVTVEPVRTQAVDDALCQADAADVVLIAGKGHEDYQEIRGERLTYSDLQQARAALERRQQGEPARV